LISGSQNLYTSPARIIDAMRLLYGNGQGEAWFSMGEEFAKRVIEKDQPNDQGANMRLG
jgi:hypothetical protein